MGTDRGAALTGTRWTGTAPGGGGPRTASTTAVRVAAWTSPGLIGLGRRLGFPVAIMAATTDPDRRLAAMVRDQHACWTMEEDWAFVGVGRPPETDPLAPSFHPIQFDPRWLGGRRPPPGIAVEGGSLIVTLPTGVGAGQLSRALHRRLAFRRFDVVAARPGQILRRRATGRPHAVVPRYSCTRHGSGAATAFLRVDDLYAFHPTDLPVVVAAVGAARAELHAAHLLLA